MVQTQKRNIYSWRTTKFGNNYKYSVLKITVRPEKTATTTIVKTGLESTRSKARNRAQKWVRYFKSQEKEK